MHHCWKGIPRSAHWWKYRTAPLAVVCPGFANGMQIKHAHNRGYHDRHIVFHNNTVAKNHERQGDTVKRASNTQQTQFRSTERYCKRQATHAASDCHAARSAPRSDPRLLDDRKTRQLLPRPATQSADKCHSVSFTFTPVELSNLSNPAKMKTSAGLTYDIVNLVNDTV